MQQQKLDLSTVPWPMIVCVAGNRDVDELFELMPHPQFWVRARAADLLVDLMKKDVSTVEKVAARLPQLQAVDADAKAWAEYLAEPDAGGTRCTTCRRSIRAGDVHLLSAYSVNCSDDYSMYVGCSSPFIDANAIPAPPARNPLDPQQWAPVFQSARAEWIQLARDNIKRKPGWDPPWTICGTCAEHLGISEADRAAAREAAERGDSAGVLTEAGKKLSDQVNAKCFVCTVAFGDADAAEVMVFRNFRDHWLRRRAWGRLAIACYEIAGPHAADVVVRFPRLRAWVRSGLKRLAAAISR